jgi:hypothetical protein
MKRKKYMTSQGKILFEWQGSRVKNLIRTIRNLSKYKVSWVCHVVASFVETIVNS